MDKSTRTGIAAWLLICCALVFAMVVVGGVTRLTHSGLSIVEWQPIVGTIPPLDDAAWQEAFHKYQQTPEYKQVNHGMSLQEFKGIFWMEYFHRLLGRLIGFVFLLPLLYFLARRKFDPPFALKLSGIFVLGALQGAMGWYMVKSGLVDDPRVSQYRLTAHLGLAFAIYGVMLWVALGLLFPERAAPGDDRLRSLRRFARGLAALIFVMVLSGGFVAGIHAGFAYNTFPLMNGHLVPPELFMLDPWYLNLFNNMATVQFDHRLIALSLAVLVPAFWLKAIKTGLPRRARLFSHLLPLALAVQITLGICTLLWVVPVGLAAAHQAGALVLFTVVLALTHALGSPSAHPGEVATLPPRQPSGSF